MKLLCLTVILANVTVFLWEYRSGAFETAEKYPAPPPTTIIEPIVLVSEIKSNPATSINPTSSPAQNPLTIEQPTDKNKAATVKPDNRNNQDVKNQLLPDEIIP